MKLFKNLMFMLVFLAYCWLHLRLGYSCSKTFVLSESITTVKAALLVVAPVQRQPAVSGQGLILQWMTIFHYTDRKQEYTPRFILWHNCQLCWISKNGSGSKHIWNQCHCQKPLSLLPTTMLFLAVNGDTTGLIPLAGVYISVNGVVHRDTRLKEQKTPSNGDLHLRRRLI